MSEDTSSAAGDDFSIQDAEASSSNYFGRMTTGKRFTPTSRLQTSRIPTAAVQLDSPSATSSLPSNQTNVNPPQTAGWLGASLNTPDSADSLFQKAQQQIHHTLSDQITPVRLAGHLSVLVVAALVLIISGAEMPSWNLSLRALPSNALVENGELSRSVAMKMSGLISNPNQSGGLAGDYLPKAAVPFTTIVQEQSEPRSEEIRVYTVQSGDTVLGIAEKFGLRPETIQWANQSLEQNPDLIRPGDQINILPVDGAIHIVSPGDTLGSISSKYKVEIDDIVTYSLNGIADSASALVVGRQLVIPNGTKPYATTQVVAYAGVVPASASKGSGGFSWPTSGSINQRYWGGHPAIDIGAWTGAPVTAADNGYVAIATGGWNGGYGNHVIVDHGNGFVTLYAHLNSIFVRPGENVAKGQQLGSVGNSGNSTGPHLHFEIRYQGVQRNPFSYLP